MGLNIPYLLECYNDYKYASAVTPAMRLDGLEEDKKPSACIGCGQCSHACPQHIDVPVALAELNELYQSGPRWSEMVKGRHEAIINDLKER